jgi:hypothetical protein
VCLLSFQKTAVRAEINNGIYLFSWREREEERQEEKKGRREEEEEEEEEEAEEETNY